MELSQIPQVTILNYEDFNLLKNRTNQTKEDHQDKKGTYKRKSEVNDMWNFPWEGRYWGGCL